MHLVDKPPDFAWWQVLNFFRGSDGGCDVVVNLNGPQNPAHPHLDHPRKYISVHRQVYSLSQSFCHFQQINSVLAVIKTIDGFLSFFPDSTSLMIFLMNILNSLNWEVVDFPLDVYDFVTNKKQINGESWVSDRTCWQRWVSHNTESVLVARRRRSRWKAGPLYRGRWNQVKTIILLAFGKIVNKTFLLELNKVNKESVVIDILISLLLISILNTVFVKWYWSKSK